jgi:hypothetical protein
MSFDDEFGGFLDRETMLAGGLPAKRANTLLFLIESRTAHLVAQSRQAMEVFLTREAAEERELAFLESFALGRKNSSRQLVNKLGLSWLRGFASISFRTRTRLVHTDRSHTSKAP